MREGELTEERPDGERKAGVAAAGIEKRLQAIERRIGDGKRAAVLIAAAQVVKPTGDDERQHLVASVLALEQIPERRHDEFRNLSRSRLSRCAQPDREWQSWRSA